MAGQIAGGYSDRKRKCPVLFSDHNLYSFEWGGHAYFENHSMVSALSSRYNTIFVKPIHSRKKQMIQKRFLALWSCLFCVALLTGCNDDAVIQKSIPKQADELGRDFLSALQKKDIDKASKLIEPKVRAEATPKIKAIVSELFKDDQAQAIKPIGVRSATRGEERMTQISYQMYYPNKWIVASLAILETPKERFVVSARLEPIPEPVEKMYRFKLFGNPLMHYVVLVAWIIVPLFILYVLVACIRSPLHWKWKLLWVPFIMMGFVTFHLDWTTGRAFLRLLGFLVMGVGVFKNKYSPWIFSVGIPVGALIFYFKYIFKFPAKKQQLTQL